MIFLSIRSLNLASNMISEMGLEMIVSELSKDRNLKVLNVGFCFCELLIVG